MLAVLILRVAGGAGTPGHGRDVLEGRPVDRRTASGLLFVTTPGGVDVALAPPGTRARNFRLVLVELSLRLPEALIRALSLPPPWPSVLPSFVCLWWG